MSGFASLEPAFTILLTFSPPLPIGQLNGGTTLQIAPITSGSVTTQPGFSGPELNASILYGTDHVHIEPSLKHVRINVSAVLKTEAGAMIHYSYTGILELTAESMMILTGAEGATTTAFGKVFTHVKFETGEPGLKNLETGIWVGCSRFVVEEGKSPVVESRISKVVFKE